MAIDDPDYAVGQSNAKELRPADYIIRIVATLLITSTAMSTSGTAQTPFDNWYFGVRAGMRFTAATPVPLTDGRTSTFEGTACISDTDGNLLFYTDGVSVWNAEHALMPNGTNLAGCQSSTQAALITPLPGSATEYVVFTTDCRERGLNAGLQYSIVDMALDNGRGDVATKNVALWSSSVEKLAAAWHANGKDVWAFAHEAGNATYLAFRVTNAGVQPTPVISQGDLVHNAALPAGELVVAPGRNLIAAVAYGIDSIANVELLRLEPESGSVAPLAVISGAGSAYGVEFSPDNTKLYVSSGAGDVLQYDITSEQAVEIEASRRVIFSAAGLETFGHLQLGPDGNIYVARNEQLFLGVIDQPNESGDAASYVHDGVYLDGRLCRLGLPGDIRGGQAPIADFIWDGAQLICAGACLQFNDLSAQAPTEWNWQFPGAEPSSSRDKNPVGICYTEPGTYTITLTVANEFGADVITKEIIVAPALVPDVGTDRSICRGDSVHLNGADPRIVEYLWSPAIGLSDPGDPQPIATPLSTTVYTLMATDANGCIAVDSVTIEVIRCFDCHSISGVINEYSPVTAIDMDEPAVIAENPERFTPGDQAILIQMQGVEIIDIDSDEYGTPIAEHGAGNYEFVIIESIIGDRIAFSAPLENRTYRPEGKIQLVSVPEYDHITVSGPLTCLPWDGSSGGVLALSAQCVMLDADMDVSGKGFRGGVYRNSPECSAQPNRVAFVSEDPCIGAAKGEGTAGFGANAGTFGRGAPANAGGGGNNHNAGGGGGALSGAGGAGGYGFMEFGFNRLASGIGGRALSKALHNKAWLGGGGGSGQANHGNGSGGASGGGIIIVRSGALVNSGSAALRARGADAVSDPALFNPDGCGGGGAGGTIIIEAREVVNMPAADVSGGNGGSVLGVITPAGPGGGGGGGLALINTESEFDGSRCIIAGGGRAGVRINGSTYGATGGTSGMWGRDISLVGQFRTPELTGCVGCIPVLAQAIDSCGVFSAVIRDGGAAIENLELIPEESQNVALTLFDDVPNLNVRAHFELIDPTLGGTATFQALNTAGRTAVFTRELAPLPTQPLIRLDDDTLRATLAQRYQWFRDAQPIPGATGRELPSPESGRYTVAIFDSSDCAVHSEPLDVLVTGIPSNSAASFAAIAPNPSDDGIFTLDLNLKRPGIVTIEARNTLGSILWQTSLYATAQRATHVIDLSREPSGIFLLIIRAESVNETVLKLLKG